MSSPRKWGSTLTAATLPTVQSCGPSTRECYTVLHKHRVVLSLVPQHAYMQWCENTERMTVWSLPRTEPKRDGTARAG